MNTTEADLGMLEAMAILVAEARSIGHPMSPASRAGGCLQSRCMATDCGLTLSVSAQPPFLLSGCPPCPGDPVVAARP